ncbi:MAG: transglycosylase SLT domain-containing protein [Neisseriaceae bacterium]|nr:transglycosylase SLT domain-containing protein [Neisseriaceae bacterium]
MTNKLILTALLAMPFFVCAENQPQMMKTVLTQPTPKAVNFNVAVKQCAKGIDPDTFQAVARTESSFNQFAIGVVSGSLKEQPRNLKDAVAAVKTLRQQGKNFSMGLVQVNVKNMTAYGLTDESIFDICENLRAGGEILKDCFSRAKGDEQQRLQQALSCYYSGNFRTGFKSSDNYVRRVVNNAKLNNDAQTINPPKATAKPKTQQVSVPKIDTSVPVPSLAVANTPKPKKIKQVQPAQTSVTQETVAQANVAQDTVAQAKVAEKQLPKREWDIFGDFAEF